MIGHLVLSNSHVEGLDPHQDTPVEILHVILLGFLKYMWRDVIQVQLKNNRAKLALLETRLTSFKTTTLGLKPLNGRTLVQYSGSLTGRDFRSIAQVAPFVIHGLVGKECYDTWLSLSKLVPLIWQPEIEEIDTYTVSCISSRKHVNITDPVDTDPPGTRNRHIPVACRQVDMPVVQQTKVPHPSPSTQAYPSIWTSDIVCH